MSVVRERTMGKFPLSVATSIALESAIGHPDPTNGRPSNNALVMYEEFWVNLKTLFRNICGCLPPNSPKPPVEDLVIAMLNEIKVIQDIVQRNSQARAVFYVSNYSRLDALYKHVELRRDNTPKQKDFTKTMESVIQRVINKLPKDDNSFKLFAHDLRPNTRKRTLILTHVPYDLVSAHNFGSLDLLESHTGHIKNKTLWYTKYFQGNDLPPIPLTHYLLPVFGDKEMFRPLNLKAKAEMLALIKKNGWNALTTDAKMKNDIKGLPNKLLVETIQSFY